MVKTTISVTVETDVVEGFDKLGLNRSGFVEDAMAAAVGVGLAAVVGGGKSVSCELCGQPLNQLNTRVWGTHRVCRACFMDSSLEVLKGLDREVGVVESKDGGVLDG